MQNPSSLLQKALDVARAAHEGQVDKAGAPYIAHPLRVMNRLPGDDEAGRIVAILHDVLEDTQVTEADLAAAGLGETLLRALRCLTHAPGEPDDVYWARIATNPLARRVKLADIADNADESRLALLPADVAARLRNKYERATAALSRSASEDDG